MKSKNNDENQLPELDAEFAEEIALSPFSRATKSIMHRNRAGRSNISADTQTEEKSQKNKEK